VKGRVIGEIVRYESGIMATAGGQAPAVVDHMYRQALSSPACDHDRGDAVL
jgi:hypothetical protein